MIDPGDRFRLEQKIDRVVNAIEGRPRGVDPEWLGRWLKAFLEEIRDAREGQRSLLFRLDDVIKVRHGASDAIADALRDSLNWSEADEIKIEDLWLSSRAFSTLKNDGVDYVGQLRTRSRRELMRIPNFGKVSMAEVKAALAKLGVTLL